MKTKTLINYRGTRLLEKQDSKCQPYIVAERYDEETGTWACGHYFDDPHEAVEKFHEIALGHKPNKRERDAIGFVKDLYGELMMLACQRVGTLNEMDDLLVQNVIRLEISDINNVTDRIYSKLIEWGEELYDEES